MTNRDNCVDIAKGICILLIVCIHTELFTIVHNPFTFIAVPMFFFMSGFFDHSERLYKTWIFNTSKSLILPAIIWCSLGMLYTFILQTLKGETYRPEISIYNPCVGNGPAWFLFALFYVKIITSVLERFKINKYIYIIIIFILGYVGSTYQMPLLTDEGLAATPIYILGKKVYPDINKFKDNIYYNIIGIISILSVIMGYVYYTIVPLANGCYTPMYIISILVIFFTFIPILSLTKYLSYVSILSEFGKNSLGIMLLHAPMCHTAAAILNRLFEKGSTYWIICFIVAYIITVCISLFISKKIIKHCSLLYGK